MLLFRLGCGEVFEGETSDSEQTSPELLARPLPPVSSFSLKRA